MATIDFRGITMNAALADCACSLYDGGWRAGDKDGIMAEYDVDEETAEEVCRGLQAIEDWEKKEAEE